MAKDSAEVDVPGAGTGGVIQPSVWNALPYFLPLTIFPVVVLSSLYGGWWLAVPFVYFWLADRFDTLFGQDEANMDPGATTESRLFAYRLAEWVWVALYPVTFVFALWQVLVAGHLSAWEALLMALVLGSMARFAHNAGHEMMHARSLWERRAAEVVLASVSFPQEATEHVCIHHPLVCTPADPVSAPKGQSFWQYFPRSVAGSVLGAWRFERNRLARRHLPVWHRTNPCWRYLIEAAVWYVLVYWMGGLWGLLIFAIICLSGLLQLKIADYVQHYGLQRVRRPGGRFERVGLHHSWTAACKFSNWLYYNSQRHADHHPAPNRLYPLLQHHGGDKSPQLPGGYGMVGGLAMFPRRWFETMDPLVDQWRARFYPEIDDWSAYDSLAYAARPDAFEAIAEIIAGAPRLGEWIERAPELLDTLQDKEFTDLDLPDGFGPDPEFETIARRGLARVYWTHEFGVREMKEELADLPIQDVADAVETARNWSNEKVFQVGVHTMRGNLSPVEAGTALSHVAEASIAQVLSAVAEEFGEGRSRAPEVGVAAVVLGDIAGGEAAPGADLDVMFLYDGGTAEDVEALCRRFREGMRALSRDNLLFASVPREREPRAVRSFGEFREHHRTAASAAELRELFRTRCVFTAGDAGTATRFDEARRDILTHGIAREVLIAELGEARDSAVEPGLLSVDDMRGGLRDVERAARFLQLIHAGAFPDVLVPGAASAFRTLGARGLIPADAAERLEEAAKMWRNLRGVLPLVMEDGSRVETAGGKVKAVIARACGADDFSALAVATRETASRAAADIAVLEGMAA